jgi:phosphoglycolate phosphatase
MTPNSLQQLIGTPPQSVVSHPAEMPYITVMKAYFFDLDGTLTDSRAGLYPAFRAGLEAIGIGPVGDEQLQSFLGTPLPELFRAMRPDVGQREIDAGMIAFRSVFEQIGITANKLYPGVIGMLSAVGRRRAKIWIVTSKPEPQAIRVVTYLGLDQYVAGVVGASLAETDTKTDLVARALSSARVAAQDAVMIGDRHYDIVGAINNRVLPVGVLWGYGSKEELEAAGCRIFAATPDEFRTVFVESGANHAAQKSLAAIAAR